MPAHGLVAAIGCLMRHRVRRLIGSSDTGCHSPPPIRPIVAPHFRHSETCRSPTSCIFSREGVCRRIRHTNRFNIVFAHPTSVDLPRYETVDPSD